VPRAHLLICQARSEIHPSRRSTSRAKISLLVYLGSLQISSYLIGFGLTPRFNTFVNVYVAPMHQQ
jgi:hypothetical protein